MRRADLDNDVIVERYRNGGTPPKIARDLGCAAGTIRARLRQQGIEPLPPPPTPRSMDDDWLRARIGEDLTAQQIAALASVHPGTVYRTARRLGLKTRPPEGTPLPDELTDPDWLAANRHRRVTELAEQLHCNTGTVYRAYRRNRVERPTRRPGPSAKSPHGTLAAYRRHFRHDEDPCDACHQAHLQYQQTRRHAARQ